MADNTATFAVDIEADASAADDAAGSLQALKTRIEADTAALRELQQAMRNLKGGTSVNIEAFRNLKDQIDAKKASIAGAQEQYVKLGGTFGDLGKKTKGAEDATGSLKELLGAAQGAGGPVGELSGKLGQLGQMAGKGGLAGIVIALVAIIVALSVAAIAAAVALVRFAVGASDAARSQRLLMEAATGSAAAGAALEASVDAMTGKVATSRAELEQTALSMARLGLTGKALESAFSAVATASAVMGQAAGSKIEALAERAKTAKRFIVGAFDLQGTGLKIADVASALASKMGVSFATAQAAIQNGQVTVEAGLEALDAAVQAKFGKIAKAQLLALPAQIARAKEGLSRLFADIKIDGFLEGLHEVLGLLDQSTFTGRALKAILEGLIQPVIDGVTKAFPYIKAFFQGMVIAALVLTIAVLKVKNALRDAFGGESTSSIDWIKVAMWAGVVAVGAMVAGVLILAAAFGIVAVSILLALSPLLLLIALAVGVGVAIGYGIALLIEAFEAAVDFLSDLDFDTIATNLINGLVNGIKDGVGFVVDAIKGLADAAMKALKSSLGIHSPSVVFRGFGINTAEGFAEGVDDGADGVESSVSRMVGTPEQAKPAGGRAAASGGNVYHVVVQGVKDADEMNSRSFVERLAEAVEGAAISGARPLTPEPAG